MAELRNVTVVIPSLDPDDRLPAVIRGVQEQGFTDILLVDDGSAPENRHFFDTAEQEMGCTVLHHPKNLGKGRALKTAFAWLLEHRPDGAGCVTIDSDGQHQAADIRACTEKMLALEEDTLVLGVRDFDGENVPPKSKFGNKCTSLVFRAFCGLKISDTQTGLRVFPRSILKQMLEISGERFEYETNMLLLCNQQRIPLAEQKIRTIYINSNETTHFHPVKDSLRVYGVILKFFLASFVSFLLDILLFAVFLSILLGSVMAPHSLFLATVFARILSSLCKCMMTFGTLSRSGTSHTVAAARHFILWGLTLLASYGLVRLLSEPFGVEQVALVTLIKGIADIFLSRIRFRVQQVWERRGEPVGKGDS